MPNTHQENTTIDPSLNVIPQAAAPDLIEPWLGEAAFQRVASLVDTIVEEEVPRINVDLTAVVVSARGALPKIKELRPEILKQLPHYELTLFDAFEDIVAALGYVDSALRASSEDRKEVTAQAEALDAKRTQLHETAVALSRFGLVDEKPLQSIKRELGYKPLISDVATLVQLLRQNWSKIEGKLPFTLKELNAIDREAVSLSTALGFKERNPEMPRETARRRRQVYGLFRQAVAHIRRAVTYLYGEEEVNEIVPTFANAPGRASKAGSAEESAKPEGTATTAGGRSTPAASAASTPFKVNNPEQLPITAPFGETEDGA